MSNEPTTNIQEGPLKDALEKHMQGLSEDEQEEFTRLVIEGGGNILDEFLGSRAEQARLAVQKKGDAELNELLELEEQLKGLKRGTPEHHQVSKAHHDKLNSISEKRVKAEMTRLIRASIDRGEALNMTSLRIKAKDLGYKGDVSALAGEVSQQKFDESKEE